MSTNIYSDAADMIRERLLARPQARGRGKSAAFIELGTKVGLWFLRRHGPHGARIFSACFEVLKRYFGVSCRAVLKALQDIGLLKHLKRANGHERKWQSPEYAAYQYELGTEFALLFPAAKPQPQMCKGGELRKEDGIRSDLVSCTLVPARTWDRTRPEFRLPSKASIRRAATASLEALRGLSLPPLSSLALATLGRPVGAMKGQTLAKTPWYRRTDGESEGEGAYGRFQDGTARSSRRGRGAGGLGRITRD